MTLRAWARERLRARGLLWFRRPNLPWGLDLQSDLHRCGIDVGVARCVVDVGAHVGLESLRFAQLFPHAEVFAFEMMPSTFATLRANVAAQPRVHPICCGLSNAPGSARIQVESDSQQNSLHHHVAPADGGAVEVVQLKRLDDVARELGIETIDLLKVDAEGHDLEVLQGASGLLAQGRVRALLVEVDFGGSAVVHGNFAQIVQWLAPHGLHVVSFHEVEVIARGKVPVFDYANALFVRAP